MRRTRVSFEAPGQTFPVDRNESDDPPGREIAELVSASLRSNGIEHQGPEERGGWAWDLHASSEHASVECIVGLVDDSPIQWLIVTDINPRGRFRRRARDETEAAAASLGDAWVRSIEEVCSGPHGWTNVRWYYKEDFDRDYGKTWSPAPFD
jgi:hypothetical protein